MENLAVIRERLVGRLAELEAQIDQLEASQRELLEDDLPEQAIERAEDEALDAVERAALDERTLTRQAIMRIDAGLYGLCTECGVPIDADRLEALPAASRCIACERERDV
ncbi:TraR/DksA C4-type zinc finger protein [Sphingopyxis fribergensis]